MKVLYAMPLNLGVIYKTHTALKKFLQGDCTSAISIVGSA